MHSTRATARRHFLGTGEVLEMHRGFAGRPGHVVRAWMNSPVHRYVLLHPAMRWIGAGASRGRFGSMRATVWVLQVAAQRR